MSTMSEGVMNILAHVFSWPYAFISFGEDFFSGICWTLTICLILHKTAKLFPSMAVPFYIPTHSCSMSRSEFDVLLLLILATLVNESWFLLVAFHFPDD